MNDQPTSDSFASDPTRRSISQGSDLDRLIRTMLVTATAEAPRPPAMERLDDLSIRRFDRHERINRRPIWGLVGGLAAAATLVAGVVIITNGNDDERQDGQAAAPEVDPSQIPRLPAHVLPAYLPEGWVLADVTEQSYREADPNLFATPSQLFRRSSDGAAIHLRLDNSGTGIESSEPTDTVAAPATDVPTEEQAETAAVPIDNGDLDEPLGTGVVTDGEIDDSFQPPIVGNDVVYLAPGSQSVQIEALANDSDPDGDDLVIVAFESLASIGYVVTLADGGRSFIVTPPAAEVDGGATFTYTVSDGTAFATGTVEVEVASTQDSPATQASSDAADAPQLVHVPSDSIAPPASPEDNVVIEAANAAGDVDAEAARRQAEVLTGQLGIVATRSNVSIVDGRGQFTEPESTVFVETIAVSDDDASQLVRSLVRDTTSPIVRFDVPDGSSFHLEGDEVPAVGEWTTTGTLSYLVDGQRGMSLLIQQSDGNLTARFGVPTVVDGVTLYVGRLATFRESLGGVVVGAPHFGEDLDTVNRVLSSVKLTDEAEWHRLADELALKYRSLPELTTMTLDGGVEISYRDAGVFKTLCVSDESHSRCHAFVGADVGPNWISSSVFWGSFGVGPGWVFAGVFDNVPLPVNEIVTDLDDGEAVISGAMEVEGGVMIGVVLPPEATSGSYDIRSGLDNEGNNISSTSGSFTFPFI